MVAILYMILATAMFFLQDTYFLIGGVQFSFKNPCVMGILFLALVNFIVTVRPGRTIILVRHTLVQILPCAIPFFFSALIWVMSVADSIMIANGTGMIIPQISSVLVATATLYLFGSRGLWYCLGSMCLANFCRVLVVVWEGGVGAFMAEFYTLIVTFSVETGPLMEALEINDLTFAFGPFLIYLLLKRKEVSHWPLWMLAASLLFVIGLKRTAILAVILSVLVVWIVQLLPEKAARQTALVIGLGMLFVSFMYIVGIRYGLFQYLEAHFGIDTKGRVAMFMNLEPYYDISITYMGKGTGFERYVDWASGERFKIPQRTLMPIHNDFLRMYLNIGFVGYWIWIWSWLMVRLRYWFKQGGKSAGCVFLGVSIYCFTLFATDNTIYYPYTMIACALVPMSCNLDTLAQRELERHRARYEGSDRK